MISLKVIFSILLAVLLAFPFCLLMERMILWGEKWGVVKRGDEEEASDEIQDHS